MANRATLDGTVFQPETRYSQKTGKPVLNFNFSWYDGKDQNGKTKYGHIRVIAFGALAENVAKFIHERDRYLVAGHLSEQHWEKDGQKHSRIVLIADDIASAFNKFSDDGGTSQVAPPPSDADAPAGETLSDEEIPF